jgi:hypothetical protein
MDLKIIQGLKSLAKRNVECNDYKSAHNYVTEAIRILEEALTDNTAPTDMLCRELADLHGIRGGILRRQGEEKDALRSYDVGRVYANMGKGDHYNQTKTILLLWLASSHPDEDMDLQSRLDLAMSSLEKAVAGSQRFNAWAWSDLGILHLLARRQNEAEYAFHQFHRCAGSHIFSMPVQNVLVDVWAHTIDRDTELSDLAKQLFVELGGKPEVLEARILQVRKEVTAYRDVFLCHASEDKVDVVSPLARALEEASISFWYDEAEIKWGDSITEKVNAGLEMSLYVVVVLTPTFLKKNWPKRELHAALNLEASTGKVKVLPLIAEPNGDYQTVISMLPLLNDKHHLRWEGNPASVVRALRKRLASDISEPGDSKETEAKRIKTKPM